MLAIGRFLDRMKFKSREEASKAIGIRASKLDYVIRNYRELKKSRKNSVPRVKQKKVRLSPVKIIDEPAKIERPSSSSLGVQMTLESGVRVSVESADAAIDLLDRLEQRKRFKAAS